MPTRPATHAKNVVAGRDFEVGEYVDVVVVQEGDPCPNCGTGLKLDRAIEIGHIFQLGRKYADALKLDVLGQHGKPVRVTMGSYGIGVSRAVAALAEQSADDKGLCWPAEVAPADVHVVAAGKALQTELALDVSEKLRAMRPARPGRRPCRCLPGREVHRLRADRRTEDPGHAAAAPPRASWN